MATETAPKSENASGASRTSAFPRYAQTFPTLTPAEIARMRGFGEIIPAP